MNFTLYQLIVPLLALVMIAKAISRFRRGQQTWRELITWIFVWGAIGFFALFPKISDKLANFIGIKSGANAIITAALVILFYIVFKLLVTSENLESKITRLNRKIALDKLKEEKTNR
ncbi:DUF2304 domain-containing protein [Candidatus Peregrinibacteria bacterium]|nr:DUF2304 domain-containing protein [Candidatus Peregrinibacteria bacterium]